VGDFKTSISISELRARNEASKAAAQKPQEQPKTQPKKG
jgi:hypothetical protein